MKVPPCRFSTRGGALLAVLWLSAALSAIAFSLALTVRGEITRSDTQTESARAQLLAEGAVHRAINYILWSGYRNPDGAPPFYAPGKPVFTFPFPSGEAVAQIIPENAKLDINSAPPEELDALFRQLGVNPKLAAELAAAIVDWRTGVPPDGASPFDAFYLAQTPSFRPRHASFEEIEELLMVRGMTPEIFHGTFVRDDQDNWISLGGARECLSVWGGGPVDVNTAHPAVLATIGVPPGAIARILEIRAVRPFQSREEVLALVGEVPRIGVGGGPFYTIRATARVRHQDGQLSDLRRSVGALVRFLDLSKHSEPFHILRWYENEWVH